MDNLISLKSNGATFGALSEKELQMIQDWATTLRANLSDDEFNRVLTDMISNLWRWLSEERFSEINWVETVETPAIQTWGSLYNYSKTKTDTSDFSSIINK